MHQYELIVLLFTLTILLWTNSVFVYTCNIYMNEMVLFSTTAIFLWINSAVVYSYFIWDLIYFQDLQLKQFTKKLESGGLKLIDDMIVDKNFSTRNNLRSFTPFSTKWDSIKGYPTVIYYTENLSIKKTV